MVTFAGVVGRGFALVAAAAWIGSRFEQEAGEVFQAGGGCLVEGSVTPGLLYVYVRSLGNQEARGLDILAQCDAGMQGLVVHGVAREPMHVGAVGQEQSCGLRTAKRGRQV